MGFGVYGRTAAAGGLSLLLCRGRVLLWVDMTPGSLSFFFPGKVPVQKAGLEKVGGPEKGNSFGLVGTAGGTVDLDRPLPND